VLARRHDVRTDVAERDERVVLLECRESSEATSCDVLEEDTLDRRLRAERENLIERRCDVPDGRDERTL
jgi:hypothetical protein